MTIENDEVIYEQPYQDLTLSFPNYRISLGGWWADLLLNDNDDAVVWRNPSMPGVTRLLRIAHMLTPFYNTWDFLTPWNALPIKSSKY